MSQVAKSNSTEKHWSDRLRPRASTASSEARAEDANQRWARRKKSDLPGLICAHSLQEPVKCRLRDGSSSGALLQLRHETAKLLVDDVPDTFTLYITNNRDYTQVSCQVIRRFGDCLGVKFTSAFQIVVKDRGSSKLAAGKRR